MTQKSAPLSDLQLTDQATATASALPSLLLAAEQLANTVVQGVHGRKKAGSGEAFWQYRLYGSGDSTARIDWRKSARSAHVYVRENEWEAANTLWLWAKANADMDFKSKLAPVSKRYRSQLVLLALAALALKAQERVGLLWPGQRAQSSRNRLSALARLLVADGSAHSLPQDFSAPHRGLAVLFSDFYDEPQAIEACVRFLAAQGLKGHLVQVYDPAEVLLPYRGRVEFRSLTGNAPAYLAGKAESLRSDYQLAFNRQREALQDLARRTGWGFTSHATDQSAAGLLLPLYLHLSQKMAVSLR